MDLSASRQRGYGQLFLFPLSSAKYISGTSIPIHSELETMSGLYELQDAVKGRTTRIECVTSRVTVMVMYYT